MVLPHESAIKVVRAEADDQIRTAGMLFREYAESLHLDLSFQDFDQELSSLPGEYAPPSGRLLLAFSGSELAGCVALRKCEDHICEMKRLFVRLSHRGQGIGKILARRVIDEAKTIGYESMRLDTLPTMTEAIAMYRSMGFSEIPPYRFNPVPGALFLEIHLKQTTRVR